MLVFFCVIIVLLENTVFLSTQAPEFVCTDGTNVSLANVCDGKAHCPDSSDEVGKLCRRVVCPRKMYRCSYGACVSRASRCNGFEDCVDGSDEFHCELEQEKLCSDREFQCSTAQKQCINLADTCNGYTDCSDGSDENETICHDFLCPEHFYRCSYGGCVHQEVLCDSVKDCVDGSDEDATTCAQINCRDNECSNCREDEFLCRSGGQCITNNKVCDGTRHCRDSSDEDRSICMSRNCPEGWFRCSYGACIRPELKCNLRPDCHDWSDEDEPLCGLTLPEDACRLPAPKPATHYTVSDCPRCRPGDVVPELTRIDYICDSEQPLEGPSAIFCQNNRWLPFVPVCPTGNQSFEITCPGISDAHGASKRCEVKWGPRKGWLPCDQPVPVGTRVFLDCPQFYERVSGASSVVCLHDGTWNHRSLSCTPICGTKDSSVAALIVNGWEISSGESLPWHATLFSHEEGRWKFFCGGTLISERVVLTAGHCVWKTSLDTIRVALGVKSNVLEENEEAQVHEIGSIEVQESYQDHDGNYGSDLALLILKKSVVVNELVRPVCLDLSSDATLVEAQKRGGIGLVAGMGITENDTYSSTLRITSMKIVSDEVCRQSQRRDFRKYLTYTSFCAGWTNGTGVCNGDSGGGLVLQKPNSTVWEVHGVVSLSPRKLGTTICDPRFYAVFTKVAVYGEWIRRILDKFPVTGPPDVNLHPNRDEIIV